MLTTFIYCRFNVKPTPNLKIRFYKSKDPVLRSNALADHAAKAAAKIGIPLHVKLCLAIPANNLASPNDVGLLQETTDVREHSLWLSHGCKYVNNLWVHNDGRVVGSRVSVPMANTQVT